MVHGTVAPGFEGVREAFERCFAELGETGAGFAASVDGRPVADLWGGEGFGPDSLVHVYSVTKPMAAFCVLVLADRGALALDDPVAAHWPAFAAGGKEAFTVRHALCHQAGVPALRSPQPPGLLLDWERTSAALAAEPAWWRPGERHGEHALLYGHLCGELVRRTDGRSLGTFWREEIAGPWRLDFHIGLQAPELARTVDLAGSIAAGERELYRLATANPPDARDLSVVNGEAWRRAEVPAINGHGSARAVARFFAGLLAGGELDGVRLLAPETVAAMTAGELTAVDVVLGEEVTWGLGVWIDVDGYGMGGLGGSLGMADPVLGLAEAYVTRQLGDHARAEALDAAVRAALA
jgi:CubicO group peptidase (beta-lactamase class C family)